MREDFIESSGMIESPSKFSLIRTQIVSTRILRGLVLVALSVGIQTLGFSAPSIGSFKLNDGSLSTTLSKVILYHEWGIEEPTEFRAGEMEDLSDAIWQPYQLKPSITVSLQLGVKTVYFQVRNGSGESEILSDTIVLEESFNPESVAISRILAQDTIDSVQFGSRVAASGDTLVVSAPNDEEFGRRAGAVYVYVQEGDEWVKQAKLVPENVAAFNRVGRSVDIDGDTIVIGSGAHIEDEVGSGIVHVFVRENGVWTQEATLLPFDGESLDNFGGFLAIDGDTVVCASVTKDRAKGAAYVFMRTNGVWTEKGKLLSNDGLTGDRFGSSVDIDLDTIVIGAESDRINGVATGSAYVFERTGDSWFETAKLLPDDLDERVIFGFKVGILGDHIAVSAIFDGTPILRAGSVQLFNRDSTGWTRGAKLEASDGDQMDRFGWGVTMSTGKLFAGSWDGSRHGAVYQFDQTGESWSQTAKYMSDLGEDEFQGDDFGQDIAFTNGHLFAGAVRNVNGTVFSFDLSGSETILQAPGVSIASSMNVEEGEDATFSAVSFGTQPISYQWQHSTNQGTDWSDIQGATGSSYTFENVTLEMSENQVRVAASNVVGSRISNPADLFVRVVIVPEVSSLTLNNGDPVTFIRQVSPRYNGTLATEFRLGETSDLAGVGWLPFDDFNFSNYTLTAGLGEKTVYFQTRTTAGESEIVSDTISLESSLNGFSYQKLFAGDRAIADYFGQSISVSGNIVVIGAPNQDGNGDDSGKAYVFENQEGSWIEVLEIIPSDNSKRDLFGTSVAIDGDTLAIGSPGDDRIGDGAGSVYVFGRDGNNWIEQAELTGLDSMPEDRFGFSIALRGDRMIIGAPDNSEAASGAGAVYIFERSDGAWNQVAKVVPSDAAPLDDFGSTLSVNGDRILVGSPDADRRGTGSAYVFIKNGEAWEEEAIFVPESPNGDEQLGTSVALFNDLAAVGAPRNRVFDDFTFSDFPSGSVFIYQRSGSDWTLLDTIDSLPDTDGEFGAGVALVEDMLVIGEPNGDSDIGPTGNAYVYTRDAVDGWKLLRKLSPRDLGRDRFGGRIAVSGVHILVGSEEDDFRSGSSYVFDSTRPPGPEFMDISTQVVNELDTLTIPLLVSDPEVQPGSFVYEFLGTDFGATVDPQTGEFSWTPSEDQGPGVYEFSVQASTDFESDTVSCSVQVLAVFSSFVGWQEDYLPSDASNEQLAYDADLDFDTNVSLIEFAGGSDPLVADFFNPIRVFWNDDQSFAEIEVRVRAEIQDLLISIDLGTDLLEWN